MREVRAERTAKFIEPMRVPPGKTIHLAKDYDPGYTGDMVRESQGKELLAAGVEMLADYQSRLAAQSTWGVLLALQSLDAGGKDGAIRHVMSGVNPQGVSVHGFKVPSATELSHDYLWRYQLKLPARGEIGIFNRSHYEEVLVVRVHEQILQSQNMPESAKGKGVWKRRYREINDWERYLSDNGFKVLKVFLNLSKEEQRTRFLKRIDLPEKNWKLSPNDAKERAFWDDYQTAFSEMLSHTSTDYAPWYVVPADNKWFARIAVAAILANTLLDIDPQYPTVDVAQRAALAETRVLLEAEAPDGAPADPFKEQQKAAAKKRKAKQKAKAKKQAKKNKAAPAK